MSIRDLAQGGQLIVKQRVERLEAFTGFETKNRYEVLTPSGQTVMFAYEESGGLSRQLLKTHRPLTLHITDLDGKDIVVASRSFFWFFAHMRVHDATGGLSALYAASSECGSGRCPLRTLREHRC